MYAKCICSHGEQSKFLIKKNLSGKKGLGRNRVANFLRNRGVINRVKKGKFAQS
jgi:hypothetical protein